MGGAKGQHGYAAYEKIPAALEYPDALWRYLPYQRPHGLPGWGVGIYRYAVTPAKHPYPGYVVGMLVGDEYGGYVLGFFSGQGKGSRYGAGAFACVYHEKAPFSAYEGAVSGGTAE